VSIEGIIASFLRKKFYTFIMLNKQFFTNCSDKHYELALLIVLITL